MNASYTVTISSLNEKSKIHYCVFHVNNYVQALGIVRMCLKTWGGFADIIGYNPNGLLIKRYFVFRAEGITETDEKSYKVLWDMAWGDKPATPEEVHPIVTDNFYEIEVKEGPKKGLLSRAIEWLKSKF